MANLVNVEITIVTSEAVKLSSCAELLSSLRHTADGTPGQFDKDRPNLRYWPGRYLPSMSLLLFPFPFPFTFAQLFLSPLFFALSQF